MKNIKEIQDLTNTMSNSNSIPDWTQYYTLDEAAEGLDGLTSATYNLLWSRMAPDTEIQETPDFAGTCAPNCLANHWASFNDALQTELQEAHNRD